MTKKSLITVFVFCLIALISSNVFAMNMSEDAKNTLDGIRNGVQNMANDAGNALEDAKDGMQNMMHNDDDDNTHMTDNSTDNESQTSIMSRNDGDYTASRTTAADVMDRNGAGSAITWIILAVVGIIIVALVWIYGTQKSNQDNY